ncbi:MAG: hypothetical protein K2G33_05190 [Duncaniella sp.]|nr:hypothetical protein [Duncaniella sp.]
MRKLSGIISSILFLLPLLPVAENPYSVYVDNEGIMRRDDSGDEVAFYGTNYTVPFAHAYRALDKLGVDRKEAIDRDVYHMTRLGFNAFRLHLWDVEISDSEGNLLDNEHMDLLDYLISRLEERGISIVLTAQTNFGNGYPERNIDTGAYSYQYDKCDIHENPEAQTKQARYLDALSRHRNRYTGRSYAEDRSIIAMEINNEPCHSGESKVVTAYINKMVKTLHKSGWKKPILYNVSHNPRVTDAYYKADIQGTTYQWYPTGLVAGHTRKGNFLPTVDQYDIPFKNLKGFADKAKLVYEFDPADILYSHIYPAIARTFRKEGFQWITQFAYDPIDMAWANSEYQTHFLNLAYTPNKAISMKIAAEATRNIPGGTDFGKYPADTVFGDFRVSYKQDLSELNNGAKFMYSNNTSTEPKNPDELLEIAGVGSSPVIRYSGSGAYFLDRINGDVWRLEVMPDVTLVTDPFEKPSLSRHVGYISHNLQDMTIALPGLGKDFHYKGINPGNSDSGHATNGGIAIKPGVYLLSKSQNALEAVPLDSHMGNIIINEYVAPAPDIVPLTVLHTPALSAQKNSTLEITAKIVGGNYEPDSVVVMPGRVSIWNQRNQSHKMEPTKNHGEYSVSIRTNDKNDHTDYFVVVYGKEGALTFPGAIPGTPLDWDFIPQGKFSVPLHSVSDPIILVNPDTDNSGMEIATIPDSWGKIHLEFENRSPLSPNYLTVSGTASSDGQEIIMRKRISEILSSRKPVAPDSRLKIALGDITGIDSMAISVIDADGFSYTATLPVKNGTETTSVSLSELALSPTALLPASYPTFLSRKFFPDTNSAPQKPHSWNDIEELRISLPGLSASQHFSFPIKGVWIEPAGSTK